jgi:hypothetical protein
MLAATMKKDNVNYTVMLETFVFEPTEKPKCQVNISSSAKTM